MNRKAVFIFICVMWLSAINSAQVSAQGNKAVWTIKVEGARGLKNTDWGPNGTSDPYVDVYVRISGMNNYNAKTPVIYNTLNPQWNYAVSHDYPADKKPFDIFFVVWDQDNLGNRFLGVARLKNPVPGQEYSLRLHRRKFLNTPTEPGKGLMPGTLKVRVDAKYPLVKAPRLKGKTDEEAKNLLQSAGLRPARTGSMITISKSLVGKVVSQNPAPGTNVSLGRMVYYYIGCLPKYGVPNVVGRRLKYARMTLHHFTNINIKYKFPAINTPRSDWMKVEEQSPKAGTQILLDAPINLVVLRPPQDFKLIVPDVVGDDIENALRTLKETNMPLVRVNKQRVSKLENNNKVISQIPKAGERITWSDEKPLRVTVGWYADGKSLYSAKLTELDKPFEVTFDKPGSATYRYIKITEPGYLIVKNDKGPDNINAMSNYYQNNRGWNKKNKRWCYLPSACRVMPGEWVVQLEPEMRESVSKKPCGFEISFIPEFDPAEPNDNLEQAVSIAADTEIIAGFMGAYDRDVYSFTVKNAGYLEVLREKLPSEIVNKDLDIKYTLYNDKKEDIGSYYMPSANYLSPGKYYIDFSAAENSWSLMRYKFTLRFHPARDAGEPNNTPKTAYEVRVGETIPVAYSINDTDYYRIKSDKPGYAVLSHDRKIPFDVDLYSYDKEGKSSGRLMYLPAAVRINGERLVSLNAVSEGTGYLIDPPAHLQIGFISADKDKYEPNDTPGQAAPIELNKTIKGLLMPRSEDDNYSFIVKDAGKIFFDLVKPEGKDIPIKGKVLSSDGKTVIADRLDLPCGVEIKTPGKYILQFGQEPGLQRLCEKQYQLTIRDGKKEDDSGGRVSENRYGKSDDSKCIGIAKKAYQLLLIRKYEEAKGLYSRALKCLPDNAAIWNDYGVSCYKLNQYDIAEQALKKAVHLNTKYALAYRNLAAIAWKKENYDAGREMAVKAAELEPSDDNLRYAAHSYILLLGKQKGEEKKRLLRKAADYYKRMKNIPKSSQENLDKIEEFLKK